MMEKVLVFIGGGNMGQLRSLDDVLLSYTYPADPEEDDDLTPWTVTGFGTGQTCMQCHKARRDNANVANQIANGYNHFGPHGSAQTDMFWGRGSYEIPGYDYEGSRSATHQSFGDGCVTCHMAFDDQPTDGGAAPEGHTVHNFEPNLDACTGCHGALDAAGLAALQQPYRDKLDEIAVLWGYADWETLELTLDDDNPSWTVAQREAVYGAVFVSSSGSYGAHNPNYANALLDAAIDYLTP